MRACCTLTYSTIGVKIIGYKVPPCLFLIGDSVIQVDLIPVQGEINVAGVSKRSLD